jgi:hypothetical protein
MGMYMLQITIIIVSGRSLNNNNCHHLLFILPLLIKSLYWTCITNPVYLLKLDYIYQDGEIEKKRKVIGSMYPGKLIFNAERLRTIRINEAVIFKVKNPEK